MPRGSPFTALCRRTAALARPPAADLHVHTTASDGDFTPSQIVAFARAARLDAVAITDHDTLAGFDAVRAETPGRVEVIPGVEWSTEHDGREYHILGLFLDPDTAAVRTALDGICARRRERFFELVRRLASAGHRLPDGLAETTAAGSASLGRRHVAGLLVWSGLAASRSDAFRQYILPVPTGSLPDHRTSAAEAIGLIRAAGGVASLAHPPAEIEEGTLAQLRGLGLAAVEVASAFNPADRLRQLARALGLATTAGSDCHGPDPAGRGVGSRGVNREELAALRELAGRPG